MKTIIRTWIAILLAVVSLRAQQSPQNGKSPAGTAQGPKQRAVTILKEPTVLGSGETWAVISWTTNESGKDHSAIYAGTDQANLKRLAQTVADTAASTAVDSYQEQEYTHLVRLNNLRPGTTYYFKADSGSEGDHGSESRSRVWTFITPALESRATAKATGHGAWPANTSASSRQPSTNRASTQAKTATQPKPQPGLLSSNPESARLQRPSPAASLPDISQRPQPR